MVSRTQLFSLTTYLLGSISLAALAQDAPAKTTNERGFQIFNHEGTEREYLIHLPENLPPKAPLVVFLHGYRGDARDYAQMGMSRVADTNRFAVVYPQGLPDRKGIPLSLIHI